MSFRDYLYEHRTAFALTCPRSHAIITGVVDGPAPFTPGWSRYSLGAIEAARYRRRRR